MTTEQIAAKLLEIADFLKSQNDPYDALKAAHKAGKEIEIWDDDKWIPMIGEARWLLPVEEYRIKPEPAFTLPPCAPGMEWHRPDGWTNAMLPSGYRPLCRDEVPQSEDRLIFPSGNTDFPSFDKRNESHFHTRTRRPLVFTHAGKQWTWHRPGDPMPCDGKREVEVILASGNPTCPKPSYSWCWNERGFDSIIGWRYADEKKTVPLGPEDVMPFTVIRRKGEAEKWHWRTVSYVDAVKVTCGNRGYEWDELASDYERNESLPLTGKWNPDAWEPCHKPA